MKTPTSPWSVKTFPKLSSVLKHLFPGFLFFSFMPLSIAQCGYGLQFKSSDMSYALGENINDVSNNFTIEFWVKPNKTIKAGMVATNAGYAGINNQSYAVWPNWYTDISKEAGAGISVGTNGIAVIEHAHNYMPATLVYYTPIPNNTWSHVAVVYIEKQPFLYLNGQLVATGLTSTKNKIHPSSNIGDILTYLNYGALDGSIDELRVWSTSLNASTISEWNKKAITSTHPNFSSLYTYYKMDSGSGVTCLDETGRGHIGTLINHITWVDGWQESLETQIPDNNIVVDNSTIYLGYGPQTATLLASGGDFYSWNGSNLSNNTGETTLFTPINEGSYTFSANTSNLAGCTKIATTNITVIDVRVSGSSTKEPKIYICHSSSEKNEKSETLILNTNSVYTHLRNHPGDHLGRCSNSALTKKADKEKSELKEFEEDNNEKSEKSKEKRNSISRITDRDNSKSNLEVSMIIYPNPSNGTINVNIATANKEEEVTLRVYDFAGKQIIERSNIAQNGITTLDLSNFAAGFYHAEVTQGAFRKLIKLTLKK
ncbi:MAG: T9SS type A sorting domain-containing protein [Bacteroidales bacterium]|nr:T9SS type A sorting domain-containing protein [Bacteroidales bacterium]